MDLDSLRTRHYLALDHLLNKNRNFIAFLWHAIFLAFAATFTNINTILPSMVVKAGGSNFQVGVLTAIMKYKQIRREKVDIQHGDQTKSIQEQMAEEALVKERIDDKGNRWTKAYFGGGEHFKNWLEQCEELGEVIVEEVDSTGYKCFEEGGEKLYRIWMKMDQTKEDDLFN